MTETTEARQARHVFISYAWKDGSELAAQLCESLKDFCIPWKDDRQMPGGTNWPTTIADELDATDLVVALVSPAANVSLACGCERLRARRKGKLVIPVMAVAGTDIPLELEGLIWRDLTGVKFAEGLRQLKADILEKREGGALPERLRRTYITAPPLPFNYIERADVLAALQEALFIDPARPSIAMTALHGMGGAGKTVLARGLLDKDVIHQAFPDGIVWVDVGQTPKHDLTARLREVAKALGDGDNLAAYDSELGATNAYRTLVSKKAALIVLDDVWRVGDIEPFRAEAPRSRVLFTTRDDSLAAATGAKRVEAGFLSRDQSRDMLAEYAGAAVDALPPVADEIVRECGGLSLGVSIVGAMLSANKDDASSWQRILHLLRDADLANIEQQFGNYPHPNLLRALQVSVDVLDPVTRERYLALAVMDDNFAIAPVIQQALWGADPSSARGTAERLVRLALAQWADNGSIRLHDLLFDYVRAQFSDREALALIQEAMRLSTHVFDRHPAQFSSQLVGRLLSSTAKATIAAFVERLKKWRGAPWLLPSTEGLTPPGTTLIATLDEPRGGIRTLAISDRGDTVAFAVHDKTNSIDPAVRVWRVGEGIETLPISVEVTSLALSPDGSRLAVSPIDEAGGIAIWSLSTQTAERLPSSSDEPIRTLTFVGSDRLACVSKDKLQTWRVSGSTPVLIESAAIAGSWDNSTDVALAYQARRLFTSDSSLSLSGLTATEWSFDGLRIATLEHHQRMRILLAVTPDARILVLGDLEMEILTRGDSFRKTGTLPGHGFIVQDLAITADGTRIASCTSSQIRLWDARPGRPNPKGNRAEKYINALEMGADGKEALSKQSDGTWHLIDTLSRVTLPRPELPPDRSWPEAAWIGSNLLVGDGQQLLVLDAAAKRVQRHIVSPVSGALVAMTPDLRQAISRAETSRTNEGRFARSQYFIWETETGALLGRIEDDRYGTDTPIVFVDRTRVAVGGEKSIRILDVHSGNLLRTLTGPTWYVDCLTVAETSDGIRIAGGSRDKMVRIWSPDRDEPLMTLAGHTYTISDVKFMPGNRRLMSCGGDNTLRIWNLENGQCEAMFTADAWILCCAVTPDGNTILAGDMAGNLHFLEMRGLEAP